MTPVDEAVERVREDLAHADAQGHHALLMPIEDLRALLSALELGRQAQQSPAGLGLHPAAPQEPSADMVLVPAVATEAMTMAARGLIMARQMHVPRNGYSLGEVARSGYYGEYWAHILTDEERAIEAPLPKGYLADLIWRAMVSAALSASTTDSEKVDHYRDDTALKFPTGEGGGS